MAEQDCEIHTLVNCQSQSLLTPGKLGTKGFALPAAIGAQIALPDAQVWVIASDDSFQVNIQELATLTQERLPVRIAVLNRATANRGGRQSEPVIMNRFPPNPVGPNLLDLAEAYGIEGLQVREKGKVAAAVTQAMTANGPVLIDMQLE